MDDNWEWFGMRVHQGTLSLSKDRTDSIAKMPMPDTKLRVRMYSG